MPEEMGGGHMVAQQWTAHPRFGHRWFHLRFWLRQGHGWLFWRLTGRYIYPAPSWRHWWEEIVAPK